MAGNPPASQGDGAGTGRSRPRARELNELIRYTMWSVFRVRDTGAIDAAAGPSGRAGRRKREGWPRLRKSGALRPMPDSG